MLLKGIASYKNFSYPYELTLTQKGFIIHDTTSGTESNLKNGHWPLYLITEESMKCVSKQASIDDKKEWAEHMIYFEMGVLLLDANIKYLLHTHMYEGDD